MHEEAMSQWLFSNKGENMEKEIKCPSCASTELWQIGGSLENVFSDVESDYLQCKKCHYKFKIVAIKRTPKFVGIAK